MTGTTHFLAGAAIGKVTGNPILAVIFGFVFHFIMDLVPHWDYGYHFERKFRHFLVALSDPLLGLFLYLGIGFWQGYDLKTWLVTFIGGVFCSLPDVLSVGARLFRIKALRPMIAFHTRMHWFIPNIDKGDVMEFEKKPITKKGIVWGIVYQIPFIVVSLWILVK